MLVNCWPSWPSFDWMCSQLMVKTTEIKKSQVTWSARCKWFGEHHSMDWFCWENLHRKPSQFSHEIWGFPVTIFPTKPIRWIFIHYWSTIGYYFNWLSYFFRGVGIPSTSHGTSFFFTSGRKTPALSAFCAFWLRILGFDSQKKLVLYQPWTESWINGHSGQEPMKLGGTDSINIFGLKFREYPQKIWPNIWY